MNGDTELGFIGGGSYNFTNGNLTSGNGTSVSSYTYQNLPLSISTPSGGSVRNYYDAIGAKHKSEITDNGDTYVYHYIRGIEFINNEIHAVNLNGGRYVYEKDEDGKPVDDYYEWNIRDHLGNTRIKFAYKNGDGGITYDPDNPEEDEILGTYHYYPFGMETEGIWTPDSNPEMQYLYNGKEKVKGLGWYDYGARYYDPAISRFSSVDRFADKYPNQSTYHYVANNPIKFIDVNGDSIDVSTLMKVDAKLGNGMVNTITDDIQNITGLTLSIGSNGHLTYAKDTSGNPVYSRGSEEARNLLTSAISNTKSIKVGYHRSKSYSAGDGIVLSDKQIDGFISGTSTDLDNRTLGYGMTFLHEVDHSPVGSGHVDSKVLGTTGDVVDRMNIIRGQMGFKWGQSLSYPSYQMSPGSKDSYIPFSRPSLNSLNKGLIPLTSRIKVTR